MGLVTVCLGQCGNQLAVSLFEAVMENVRSVRGHSEYKRVALSRFFRRPAFGFDSAIISPSTEDPIGTPTAALQAVSEAPTAQPDRLGTALGLAKRVRSSSAVASKRSPYEAAKLPTRTAVATSTKKTALRTSRSSSKQPVSAEAAKQSQEREMSRPPSALEAPRVQVAEPASSFLVAKAVLIDMEPKVCRSLFLPEAGDLLTWLWQVIHGCLDQARASKTWCFDRKQTYWQQSGSGNNWAHGYYRHGPASAAGIMERIERVERVSESFRKITRLDEAFQALLRHVTLFAQEVRNTPDFEGFLILQSVAGGTGSGLGACFPFGIFHFSCFSVCIVVGYQAHSLQKHCEHGIQMLFSSTSLSGRLLPVKSACNTTTQCFLSLLLQGYVSVPFHWWFVSVCSLVRLAVACHGCLR
jgi:hypothetical protein